MDGDKDREDRDLIEELSELTLALEALIELLSNPITVQIIEGTSEVPTTIILIPGTPRPN
jgi:hypothetical protein